MTSAAAAAAPRPAAQPAPPPPAAPLISLRVQRKALLTLALLAPLFSLTLIGLSAFSVIPISTTLALLSFPVSIAVFGVLSTLGIKRYDYTNQADLNFMKAQAKGMSASQLVERHGARWSDIVVKDEMRKRFLVEVCNQSMTLEQFSQLNKILFTSDLVAPQSIQPVIDCRNAYLALKSRHEATEPLERQFIELVDLHLIPLLFPDRPRPETIERTNINTPTKAELEEYIKLSMTISELAEYAGVELLSQIDEPTIKRKFLRDLCSQGARLENFSRFSSKVFQLPVISRDFAAFIRIRSDYKEAALNCRPVHQYIAEFSREIVRLFAS